MPAVPFEPFIGMAAVVGALFAFAGLLQAGLFVVRWLKLPQDLPEGAYFSPPAPPIADRLTPAEARARAQATVALRRLYVMAHLAQRAAVACADTIALAPSERQPTLVALTERAKAAAEAADAAARQAAPADPDRVRAGLRAALAARREARAAVADCAGDDGARRRRLLLMLGVLVVLWALSMTLILIRR